VHDYRAILLMEACQEAKLRIPDDIAVIGMDNDVTVCEHSAPTLTSVMRGSQRVGWEAAALVDRIMQGEPTPTEDLLIIPDGVVERQSTDMLYCADPLVKSALDYMRDNLGTQFNITAIAEHAGVSKRTLETRFRTHLECSPHDFLTRLRIQRAETLMGQADARTIERIAAECGFGAVSTFHAAFQRISSTSPRTKA
jgi:LacI family transcriptional regulator